MKTVEIERSLSTNYFLPKNIACRQENKVCFVRPKEIPTLDMAPMTGILEYHPGEFTFTALAGTPLIEIEPMLAEQGQFLPFDPHSSRQALPWWNHRLWIERLWPISIWRFARFHSWLEIPGWEWKTLLRLGQSGQERSWVRYSQLRWSAAWVVWERSSKQPSRYSQTHRLHHSNRPVRFTSECNGGISTTNFSSIGFVLS
jgi:hypothetical protein